MTKYERFIIDLVKGALTGATEPPELPDDINWEQLQLFARSHQIVPLLYYAIKGMGLQPPGECMQQLRLEALENIIIDEKQLYEMNAISDAFEQNGIDFMLLKGCLIKPLYPLREMRTMGDLDVLIRPDQYEQIIPIMTELGFSDTKNVAEVEHVWLKGDIHIELHVKPYANNFDVTGYFKSGWQLAKGKTPGRQHSFEMTDEDYFIYIFMHFVKHFRGSGVGIRHITDLWIYLSAKPDLDMYYINSQLQALELGEFFGHAMQALRVWFDGAPGDEISDYITRRIFTSGAYGTAEGGFLFNAVKNNKPGSGRKNARWKKLVYVIFLPYSVMCESFPVLKKAPVLLPFLWVFRWFRGIFMRRSKLKTEIRDFRTTKAERIAEYERDMQRVGLGRYLG